MALRSSMGHTPVTLVAKNDFASGPTRGRDSLFLSFLRIFSFFSFSSSSSLSRSRVRLHEVAWLCPRREERQKKNDVAGSLLCSSSRFMLSFINIYFICHRSNFSIVISPVIIIGI